MSLQAKYTEDDRAVALAFYDACGKNIREAARKANVPYQTLQRWVSGGATNEAVARKRAEVKKDLADKLEQIAHDLADAIPGKIDRAGLQASAVTLGVAVDKMRLLRGESTENVSVDDIRAAVHEKWSVLTARRRAAAVPGEPDRN